MSVISLLVGRKEGGMVEREKERKGDLSHVSVLRRKIR